MDFSMTRFTQLLKRDYILHNKRAFASILLLILVLSFLSFLGHRLINPEEAGGLQLIMIGYLGSIIFIGGFLTSSNLGDLKTPARRIQYLAMPASNFEKVLSKWLYTLVLFLAVVLIIFYGFAYGYFNLFADKGFDNVHRLYALFTERLFPLFSMLFIIGHSIAFFFSFLFNSFAAVKGGILTALVFLLITLVLTVFQLDKGQSFSFVWGEAIYNVLLTLQENIKKFLLIAPFFWALSYFVFTRKTA